MSSSPPWQRGLEMNEVLSPRERTCEKINPCHPERSEGSVRLKAHLVGEVKVLSSFIQRQTVIRLQLRRGNARWRAAGGERPVRSKTNSIRLTRLVSPQMMSETRSPRKRGDLSGLLRDDVRRRPGDAPVVGDGMVSRPGA